MSKFEVKCTRPGCGQGMETPDIDEMMAWSATHDEACPALKAPEVAPEIIAEAVKRGTVKALRGEAERLHGLGLGGGGTAAHALLDIARRIESGEVTL